MDARTTGPIGIRPAFPNQVAGRVNDRTETVLSREKMGKELSCRKMRCPEIECFCYLATGVCHLFKVDAENHADPIS